MGSADGRPGHERRGAWSGLGIDQVRVEGRQDGLEHSGLVPVAVADLSEGG
ncbi:MAG: hypothetical protein M3548_18000 [Actinomycetota bacterium]|nr:hypothetical protein [Actinomycetota bacterium]